MSVPPANSTLINRNLSRKVPVLYRHGKFAQASLFQFPGDFEGNTVNSKLVPLISADDIADAVQTLAQEIDQDYDGQPLVVVTVLKGAFIFTADLIRKIKTPISRVELIRLSSYGAGTTSSGQVKVLSDLAPEVIAHQHVLLVEDIVDTGRSTSTAIALLKQHHPASVKLCSLLDKPSRRIVPIQIDYLGFTVEDRFVIGYGLDWDESYRELPGIYGVEGE